MSPGLWRALGQGDIHLAVGFVDDGFDRAHPFEVVARVWREKGVVVGGYGRRVVKVSVKHLRQKSAYKAATS